jgi:hypothetical protein
MLNKDIPLAYNVEKLGLGVIQILAFVGNNFNYLKGF